MEYYEHINKIRREQKMTKKELSRLSGVSREYIGKIEGGVSSDKATFGLISRIASALGKKVMVIFYE